MERAALEGRDGQNKSNAIVRRLEILTEETEDDEDEKMLDSETEKEKTEDARSAHLKRIEKLDALIASHVHD